MTIGVVHLLEVIDVDQTDGEGRVVALRLGQAGRELLIQVAPVVDAGEFVDDRLGPELIVALLGPQKDGHLCPEDIGVDGRRYEGAGTLVEQLGPLPRLHGCAEYEQRHLAEAGAVEEALVQRGILEYQRPVEEHQVARRLGVCRDLERLGAVGGDDEVVHLVWDRRLCLGTGVGVGRRDQNPTQGRLAHPLLTGLIVLLGGVRFRSVPSRPRRFCSPVLSLSKGYDIVNPAGTGDEHDEPIQAESNAGCWRHPFQIPEKWLVQRQPRPSPSAPSASAPAASPSAPRLALVAEPSPLTSGAGEFTEAVGQFQPASIRLEALSHRRVPRLQTSQGCLRRRVLPKMDSTPHGGQSGLDTLHQKLLEGRAPIIPLVDAPAALALGLTTKNTRVLYCPRRLEIDSSEAPEGVDYGDSRPRCPQVCQTLCPLGHRRTPQGAGGVGNEALHVGGNPVVADVGAVPFDHRELRPMLRPTLI